MASAEEVAATGSSAGNLARPLIIAATFAAGAGAALAAKSVLDSRRKSSAREAEPGAERSSDEDLATTLRRAAMDVAIAATNEAAERLSVEEKGREPALQR